MFTAEADMGHIRRAGVAVLVGSAKIGITLHLVVGECYDPKILCLACRAERVVGRCHEACGHRVNSVTERAWNDCSERRGYPRHHLSGAENSRFGNSVRCVGFSPHLWRECAQLVHNHVDNSMASPCEELGKSSSTPACRARAPLHLVVR